LNFISFLIFIPLQIGFLPLGLLGILLVAYKQIIVSKRLGSSQTAIEVLNGRWTMHVFGIRKDDATEKLARALPNTSTQGLWLVLFPLWVKYKISHCYFAYPRLPKAGEENIADLMIARTIYFDNIIERLVEDAEQFVVLGAGYDTRCYGAFKDRRLTFFELDQPDTQRMKIEWLLKADIDSGHVKFVSVDFSQDNVFEKLKESGYDTGKKTVFLWEGVTLNLSENDVRKMLREIGIHSVSGSAIVADIYAERFIQIGKAKAGKKVLDYTNEGLGFGLPFNTNFESALNTFVANENLSVGETYFMGNTDKKGPFMVVSEIRVLNCIK
jgi:methyltransferase (TIGR00027 family)